MTLDHSKAIAAWTGIAYYCRLCGQPAKRCKCRTPRWKVVKVGTIWIWKGGVDRGE